MTETIINPGEIQTKYIIKGDGEFDVIRTQDTTPILEMNKTMQNSGDDGYTPSRDLRHVATIPNILLELWAKQAGVPPLGREMTEIIRKKINDPDYAFLRTVAKR